VLQRACRRLDRRRVAMAPMSAPRRLHVHFCDAGEPTEVLVHSGQDILCTVSQKIGVPVHVIALELLDGKVPYDPALHAMCNHIRAVRRRGGAGHRGEASTGSQLQSDLFNFPSAKILLTTETQGIFSQETAVYELLDNALESVYLRSIASGPLHRIFFKSSCSSTSRATFCGSWTTGAA